MNTESLELGHKLLAELDTMKPDAIAKKLEHMGIKALRRAPDNCAVSQYMRNAVGVKDVCTGGVSVISDDWSEPHALNAYNFKPDGGLREFVCNFDHGMYPAIIHPDSQ